MHRGLASASTYPPGALLSEVQAGHVSCRSGAVTQHRVGDQERHWIAFQSCMQGTASCAQWWLDVGLAWDCLAALQDLSFPLSVGIRLAPSSEGCPRTKRRNTCHVLRKSLAPHRKPRLPVHSRATGPLRVLGSRPPSLQAANSPAQLPSQTGCFLRGSWGVLKPLYKPGRDTCAKERGNNRELCWLRRGGAGREGSPGRLGRGSGF